MAKHFGASLIDFTPNQVCMRRHEFWRLYYRARPYLSHLTIDELATRSQDVLANITVLNSKGQIGLMSPSGSAGYPWMELWTHILEEFARREMELPANCLDPETIPNPTAPLPAKGFLESQGLKKDLSRCLVKYGNRSWLSKTMETGEWRVSPASYYANSDLNKATRDSEMEFHFNIASFEKTPVPVIGVDGEHYHRLKEVITIDVNAATDSYIACLARGLIYRMFDDFNADACLIIIDEDEFVRRMLRAFTAFHPQWYGTFKPVGYIDPCIARFPLDIYFAKHFRYSYQEEVRFVWTQPPPSLADLPQITLSLGPLNDICEMLLLQSLSPA